MGVLKINASTFHSLYVAKERQKVKKKKRNFSLFFLFPIFLFIFQLKEIFDKALKERMAKWTALSKEQKLEMDVKTIHEAYQFLVKKVVDEKAKLSVGKILSYHKRIKEEEEDDSSDEDEESEAEESNEAFENFMNRY